MNHSKLIRCSLAALASLSLTSCGNKVSSSNLTASYEISSYSEISSMGWEVVDNYQLLTYDDNTYRLITTQDIFGKIDSGYETKGHRNIVTMGTFTEEASADGLEAHYDLKLSASPVVYITQHEKAYGRNSDILGTVTAIDTSNWTEAMTEATVSTYTNGAADVLAHYGSAKKVTVEKPDATGEDTTLGNRLVSVPEADESGAAAPSYDSFKKVTGAFDKSTYSDISAMGWYIYNNDLVITYDDGTYDRVRSINMFGAIDSGFETKGSRKIVTSGNYSRASTSSDEIEGHVDMTLNASSRVFLVQRDKAWSRNTDVIGTPLTVDTDNWTEAMNEAVVGTYTNGKEDFLSHYGAGGKFIIEDPTLNPDDASLQYRLIGEAE